MVFHSSACRISCVHVGLSNLPSCERLAHLSPSPRPHADGVAPLEHEAPSHALDARHSPCCLLASWPGPGLVLCLGWCCLVSSRLHPGTKLWCPATAWAWSFTPVRGQTAAQPHSPTCAVPGVRAPVSWA